MGSNRSINRMLRTAYFRRYAACSARPGQPAIAPAWAACVRVRPSESLASILGRRAAGGLSSHCQPPSVPHLKPSAFLVLHLARIQRCKAMSFFPRCVPTSAVQSAAANLRTCRALQGVEVPVPPKVRCVRGVQSLRQTHAQGQQTAVQGSFRRAVGSPCALTGPMLCTAGVLLPGVAHRRCGHRGPCRKRRTVAAFCSGCPRARKARLRSLAA